MAPFGPGRLPDFRIASTGGRSTALRDFRGCPALFYGWASWHPSREALPAFDKLARKLAGKVRAAGIAFDAENPGRPMAVYAAGRCAHLPLIDATFQLCRKWGVKDLPFWVAVDAEGTALGSGDRWDPKAAERALKGRAKGVRRTPSRKRDVEGEKLEFLVQQAGIVLSRGRREEAAAFLDQAAALDPGNRLVRWQKLAVLHPDRFYAGRIDEKWAAERVR